MAFVPRKSKDKFVFEESSDEKSSDLETLRKRQSNSNELISNLKTESKTYNDMTVEVLNILESQGINIYDENRKPGMYQRGREGIEEVQINNIVQSLSKNNKKFEDFVEDDKSNTNKNESNNNVNSLLNFLKKKK